MCFQIVFILKCFKQNEHFLTKYKIQVKQWTNYCINRTFFLVHCTTQEYMHSCIFCGMVLFGITLK